jgi:hypothetical protein
VRKSERILRKLDLLNPEAVLFDGFEEALLGWGRQFTNPALAIYDGETMLRILRKRCELTREEAIEFIDFNVAGAWLGEMTPIILWEE